MPPKSRSRSAKQSKKAQEKKARKLLQERINNAQEKCEEARLYLEPTGRNAEPNYTKAAAALEIAIETYAENAIAFFLLGECHRAQDALDEAISHYSHSLDLDPKFIRALECRALCYRRLRDWTHAKEDYTSMIEFEPNNDFAYNMRGLCILSCRVPGLRLRSADFHSCVHDFKTAIRLNDANFYAWANLGKAYEDQSEFELAYQSYSSALRVKADYTHAKFRRGCVALSMAEQIADGLEARMATTDSDAVPHGRDGSAIPRSPHTRSGLPQTMDDVAQEVQTKLWAASERKVFREWLELATSDFSELLNPDPEANKLLEDAMVVMKLGTCALLSEDLKKADEYFKYVDAIVSARPSLVEAGEAEPVEDAELLQHVLSIQKTTLKERKNLLAFTNS